ncbi:MAG: cytochrome c-type biogenesis protein, partial [Microthrixaceae bacterium]
MAVVVVGVFAFAGGRPPEDGTSDDRLYALGEQLKCLQCVGESVAASQSPLAEQFREEIRAQMATGETDDEILAFFADRYGDEVLLDPPATGVGALAWLLPVLVAGGAVVGLGFAFTRWRHSDAEPSGPRIDDVVAVGDRPVGSRSGGNRSVGNQSVGETPSGDAEEPEAAPRRKGALIAAGIGGFALVVAVLLISGTRDRGDGEITGLAIGEGDAAGSTGLEQCQPLAMSDPQAGIDCYDDILQADP